MKKAIKRAVITLLIILFTGAGGGMAWIYWRSHACLPQLDGEIAVPGLEGRVEVLRDAHGVPHLRAQSLGDLAFAQGYVTAQDRLWQMDLSRRLAAGELSEIFGERALRMDIENRTLGFREASERAVDELDPESRRLLDLYAQGINTFIDTHQRWLPIEFLMLRYHPRHWRAADTFGISLNMAKMLNWMWPDELMRERIRAKVGNELYADLFPDHSPLDHPVAELPHRGADGRAQLLRVLNAANLIDQTPSPPAPLPQGGEGREDTYSHPRPLAGMGEIASDPCLRPSAGEREIASNPYPRPLGGEGGAQRRVRGLPHHGLMPRSVEVDPTLAETSVGFGTPPKHGVVPHLDQLLVPNWLWSNGEASSRPGLGSNNWVVSGSHTQSGKPLLANDPHLGHSIPSVWYMIHMKAPGLNVIGVSLPGVPQVIIGHNERIAWGMTNVDPDVQDLYVESFNFREPNKYLHDGQWVAATARDEVIKVRGASDYRFAVKVTRHGPVISHEGDHDFALRWTALEPHALGFSFLKVNQARNWEEFREGLRSFVGPMQNFVYADVDGNIGYYAPGRVPIRKQGDGTLPSSGSTDEYDWSGYIPFEDLPHAYNPASGMLATANGRIVPDGYPYLISKRWEAPFRTARIYQLLEAGSHFTVADMLRIQSDILTREDEWLAKELLFSGAQRRPATPDAAHALGLLTNWYPEATADSAATLVCEVTRRALLERVLRPKLGDDVSGYHWAMSTVFLQNVIDNRLPRWLPPGDASFDETLIKSLEDGVRRIPGLVHGQTYAAWKWGNTIPLTFHHPLSAGLPLLGRWLLDVGPFPQAGTGTTVKQTTPRIGPSMRMVVDFSDLDQSVQNITLGESGQVFSPYYRDQFEAWYNGRSFHMLFSDAAVDKGTVHRLVLKP